MTRRSLRRIDLDQGEPLPFAIPEENAEGEIFTPQAKERAMPDDVSFRNKGAAPRKSALPDFNAWSDGQDRVLRMWTQLSSGMMRNTFEFSQEIMTLSRNQWQAGLGAWEAFASCRNPSDLFDRQRQFAEQTARQYFDMGSKLATRILELVRGAQEQALKP
jgi:hypothetical protein